MLNLDLRGRRALVCGSSQGIGLACAEQLARQNAQIILIARDSDRLSDACKGLPRPADQEHGWLVADFRESDVIHARARQCLEEYGPVHIVINNTGGPPGGPLLEANPEDFLNTFHAHVLSSQMLAKALVPVMKKEGYGRIINIISTSVKQPIANLGVSNTIRAAMANWAKTLAREVGPDGITVNNVLPGATETARLQSIVAAQAQKQGKSQAQVRESMRGSIPLGRFADPDETAAAVGFLASPAAAYITGINLPVDGGRTASL